MAKYALSLIPVIIANMDIDIAKAYNNFLNLFLSTQNRSVLAPIIRDT